MYPKGIVSAGFGLKNVGGKLLGASKGIESMGEKKEHAIVMSALMAAAPDVAAKYGLLEKGKK
jgi:hypothetical protein